MYIIFWRLVRLLSPSLIPITLGDILSIFILIQISKSSDTSIFTQIFYVLSESITSYFIGKISDLWSRKNVLIVLHILAFIFFIFYFVTNNLFILMLTGIIFSPGCPARASIIDNYESLIVKFHSDNLYTNFKLTECRLLAISWLAQYFPWILFPILFLLPKDIYSVGISVLILKSLTLILISFKDELDCKLKEKKQKIFKFYIKSPYTLLALLFSQITFSIPFESLDYLPKDQFLFFLVGIGATCGTILSLFYQKTPHISVIVTAYGFGFMLSFLTFLYMIFMKNSVSMGLQLVLLSALGGFYLPFVFDILVNKVSVNYRGTMFAYAEIAQSLASLMGIIIVTFYKNSIIFLFSLTTFFFILALFYQLKEEKYEYFHR